MRANSFPHLNNLKSAQVTGFAAHWTWIWCVFWSSIFYEAGESHLTDILASMGLAGIEPLWVVSLLANVVTMALLVLAVKRFKVLASVSWLPPLAAGTTFVGTLMVSHIVQSAAAGLGSGLYIAGSVLTGMGSGTVVVLWGELLASVGSRETIHSSILSLIIAAVAYIAISVLPTSIAQLLVSLMPLASMALYLRAKKDRASNLRIQRGRSEGGKLPLRLVVIALFFGISFGFMKGCMAPVSNDLLGIRDMLNIVAIVLGVLALQLTSNVLKMDFDHLTYQVALPLMAAGFLFLPMQEPWSVIGTAVHQCGYQYFYIVLWATWAVIASKGNMPVGRLTAWSMLSIQLGQFVGSLAAAVVFGSALDAMGRAMISSSAIFVILIVAIFVFGDKNATSGWGYAKPGEEDADKPSDLETALRRLASRTGLSPREAEVFALLAHGRTRNYIGAELMIGEETVKSHVKNIYRKMDLHSQQDAIDLLDTEIHLVKSGQPEFEDA